MRLLFIGDIVGRAGRAAVAEYVPALRRALALDFIVANGENAAGGFGITETIAQEFLGAGVDCVTLGNHAFDQREALVFLERAPHVLRPINYPAGTPGRGTWLFETAKSERVLVMSVMGRVFMDALDDPFAAVEKELAACPLGLACDAAILDIHAEASSEKQAMAHFCDGRVSLAIGTHTHVPTADGRILPHGTAFQTDAGMTGDYDSVIGMDKEEPIRRFTRKTPGARFDPADGPPTLCGLFVETGPDGLANRVAPVRVGGALAQALPELD
ncbi:MAG TPA: TIGR00282 family metallophosphoesterase [Rhodoblastus sp.]|nr:TIGR00282 family metallophosphoesterase [Rhodoblastus sp.]